MANSNFRKAKAIEYKNIANQKFGRLLVLERVEDAINPNGSRAVRYRCLCDCGKEKIVRKCHLVSGATVSCGCFHNEMLGNSRRKHGFSHKERLYSVWLNMKDRCYNPNNNHYSSYGARGIVVCPEWLNSYLCFRDWCLQNGYIEEIRDSGRNNITIDRIDVNGNYEPSNCRFVSNKENCLNKRDTMSYEERNKTCPICGRAFTVSKRNQQQTCSAKCGQVIKKMRFKSERNLDGTYKKTKRQA